MKAIAARSGDREALRIRHVVLWLTVALCGCGSSTSPKAAPPPTPTPTATSTRLSTATVASSPTPTPSHTATVAATASPTVAPTATPTAATLSCAGLAGQSFGAARIRSATRVAAANGDPEYCRVTARIDPALNFELRLPTQWNHKVVFFGGGGYDGSIPPLTGFGPSPGVLQNGYATIATDSGHQGSPFDASWAFGNAQAVNDFAFLARHTVLLSARQILAARYGTPIQRTYFEGGSNGGREALIEAQRWPNEYDGVIAREPAYNFTALNLAANRIATRMFAPGGFVSAGKLQTLARAELDACDPLDGLADGIISHVAACHFDPASVRCNGPESDACLTDEQIGTITTVRSELHLDIELADGISGYPGYPLGAEDTPTGWPLWMTGASPDTPGSLLFVLQDQFIKYFVTNDPQYDSLNFSPAAHAEALRSVSELLDATDADLSVFRAHGGKVILWHGWTDYGISAYSTVEYYNRLVTTAGGQSQADTFVRFYTSPGVDHLGNGAGAPIFDLVSALDAWVDTNEAPGDLIAYKNADNGPPIPFRPLCRYPTYPRYAGSGDPDVASSFTCAAP